MGFFSLKKGQQQKITIIIITIIIYIYIQEILHLPVVFLQSPSCPARRSPGVMLCRRMWQRAQGEHPLTATAGQLHFQVDRLNSREDVQLNSNNNDSKHPSNPAFTIFVRQKFPKLLAEIAGTQEHHHPCCWGYKHFRQWKNPQIRILGVSPCLGVSAPPGASKTRTAHHPTPTAAELGHQSCHLPQYR